MTQLTAQQAIDAITAETAKVFGQTAQKYNYGHEIREQLEMMAQANKTNPKEYYKALKIVWDGPAMLNCSKRAELEALEK
jgi:hypothetical protein